MAEIFVFGSNLMGIHKKGAALCALNDHGAILGQGHGLQGNSYAIPTKETPWKTLTLKIINQFVERFYLYAMYSDYLTFNVTPIGCGLAGHSPKDIARMFRLAQYLPNVNLPSIFLEILANSTNLEQI